MLGPSTGCPLLVNKLFWVNGQYGLDGFTSVMPDTFRLVKFSVDVEVDDEGGGGAGLDLYVITLPLGVISVLSPLADLIVVVPPLCII